MSFMNRKMFNRNARNKLNTMGGIASFSNGGSIFPSSLFGQSQFNKLLDQGYSASQARQIINSPNLTKTPQGFISLDIPRTRDPSGGIVSKNRLPTINLSGQDVKNIAQQRLNRSKFKPGLASIFSPEEATSPGGAAASQLGKTITEKLIDAPAKGVASLLNIFKPFSGMTPGVEKKLATGEGDIDLTGVDITQIPNIQNIPGYENFGRPIGMVPGRITKVVPEGSKGPKPFPKTSADIISDDTNIVTDMSKDQEKIIEEQTRMQQGQLPLVKPEGDVTKKKVLDQEGGVAQGIDEEDKDDIVEPKATTKEAVEKLINSGSPEEQQSELKQLMSEFKQNAPKYEGMDKNLALAKVFFSIAAGKSPDAITNIASGLEKGADVFIKDKEKRNAFNRQIDLAALKHGLVERSKDRKLKYFIADKELTIDGKKYDKGSVVDLSEGFIRKNGIPSGLSTESLTKAAMDNATEIKKALSKLQKEKILAPKDFSTFSKRVDTAALNFTKSRNLQTLIQGQIFNVADGNITGGLNAGKALVKKAFNVAKIETDKKYSTIAEYNRDMEEVANTLIQQILGEGSKNLSNVDRSLAQEIVGLYTSGASGVTGYAFVDDDVLLKRLQRIQDKVQLTQQSSLAEIEDVLSATNGLTFQSGQAVKFSKIRNLGLYQKPQGGTQGGKTQTIKLGTLLTDGKFDKNKFNKALLG